MALKTGSTTGPGAPEGALGCCRSDRPGNRRRSSLGAGTTQQERGDRGHDGKCPQLSCPGLDSQRSLTSFLLHGFQAHTLASLSKPGSTHFQAEWAPGCRQRGPSPWLDVPDGGAACGLEAGLQKCPQTRLQLHAFKRILSQDFN